ncbi:MAG: GNVR domain-containing protein [Bacillota bacterium]|nr:GNVR domain-containing protein [Bacillota bacterium]
MEEMDLREYWDIIVKKRGIVAIVFIVTVLAVTVYSLLATPIYEAFTTVIVRESGLSMQSMFLEGVMGGTGTANTAQNYMQIMKSRTILEQVSNILGSEDLTPRALEKAITVQPIQGSDVLKISMESPEPELAQRTVNTLADVFINWNTLYQRDDRRTARLFIEVQLEGAAENLRLAEEELKAYKERERVFSLADETVAKIAQVSQLEANLTETQIAIQEVQERIGQVRASLEREDETLISSTTIAQNTFVTEYRRRLSDLEIRLSSAREKYTDRHPTIISLLAEIEDVKAKLAEEVQRVIGTETMSVNPVHRQLYGNLIDLEVETMGLHARETALLTLIAEQEKELDLLPTRELELARLMRNAKVMEELYLLLRTRYEEARISEVMQTADVQVIDDAILPENPVKPRVKLNIAIGIVLGLFLGVGLAFLLEFMDNTINDQDDVERWLGLPVLAQIPELSVTEARHRKSVRRKKGRELGA